MPIGELIDMDGTTRKKLLEEIGELECREHKDQHPELHKLIVDYIFDHYSVMRKII